MKIVFVESLSRWARGLTASDNRVVSGRKFTPIDERKKKWYGTKDKDGCWSKKDALSTRSIVERVYCRLVSMPFEVGKTRVDRSFDFCSLPLWRLV